MIIFSLAFAFWAFLIASNIFNSFWAWAASAVITFIIMMIAATYEIAAIIGIVIGLFALLTIFLPRSKRK